LKTSGVIILRGFHTDITSFSSLVAACSSRVSLDPSRRFHGPNAQLVDAGDTSLDMHAENANSPFRPDFIWFFCERAAEKDGATTFCDGVQVLESMHETTRRMFENHQIQYRRTYPANMWKLYIAHVLNNGTSADEIGEEHLEQAFGDANGVYYRLNDNGSLYTCYTRSALYPTLFAQLQSFSNSILGPYPGQAITFDNGDEIPAGVIEEVRRLHEKHTEEISWQDGDVAVIDNTRFLHGRRGFPSGRRQIFAALSFA
jgi:hypothetical protein